VVVNCSALFRFDTSEFDLVSDDDKARMDIATKGYDSGLLTWKQGRTYSKHAELDDKAYTFDFLKIEGLPIPLNEVSSYWKYKLLTKPAPTENAPVSEALGVSAPETVNQISAPAEVPKLPATIPGKWAAPPPPARVLPLARYLRPATHYALPLPSAERREEGEPA
jgi:hypothetical protein